MEVPSVSQDDLMDVMEMSRKMESYFSNILKENDMNLAISALMTTTINCMLGQSRTLDEILFFRNLFVRMLDSSIRTIRIQGPEDPV